MSDLREGFTELTTMSAAGLIGTIIFGYAVLNLLFGSLYMLVGVEHIGNADLGSTGGRWMSAIGMSLETITTVGYGSLYPASPMVWMVAGVEGVFGILGFSLISAVIFARFARPKARLAYGDAALIAPFKEGWSLQVRLANRRSTLLSEVEAKVLLVMADIEAGSEKLQYFDLPLQFRSISYLPLSWTLVHPITSESPLAGMSKADLAQRSAEMIITIKGVDEGYMQHVIARHSYRFDEILWGGRFTLAFSAKNGVMHLDLDKLSAFTPVEAPEHLPN